MSSDDGVIKNYVSGLKMAFNLQLSADDGVIS